jgi:hypothetical protein
MGMNFRIISGTIVLQSNGKSTLAHNTEQVKTECWSALFGAQYTASDQTGPISKDISEE